MYVHLCFVTTPGHVSGDLTDTQNRLVVAMGVRSRGRDGFGVWA